MLAMFPSSEIINHYLSKKFDQHQELRVRNKALQFAKKFCCEQCFLCQV